MREINMESVKVLDGRSKTQRLREIIQSIKPGRCIPIDDLAQEVTVCRSHALQVAKRMNVTIVVRDPDTGKSVYCAKRPD